MLYQHNFLKIYNAFIQDEKKKQPLIEFRPIKRKGKRMNEWILPYGFRTQINYAQIVKISSIKNDFKKCY